MSLIVLLKTLGYPEEFSVGSLFISYLILKQDLK